ncbi:MAG TPA: 2-phospho-L-lactate transferase, partial [Acidimicrobiia bacterium]|nr:2-phospho-L-lactate transferase [Acidimicrobiia bacterium]
VMAVSPLIGGRALKGPADVVMADLGLGSGSSAVVASYRGLIDTLVVDITDSDDARDIDGVNVVALETRIADRSNAATLARAILSL